MIETHILSLIRQEDFSDSRSTSQKHQPIFQIPPQILPRQPCAHLQQHPKILLPKPPCLELCQPAAAKKRIKIYNVCFIKQSLHGSNTHIVEESL